jgi:hypothetical protein
MRKTFLILSLLAFSLGSCSETPEGVEEPESAREIIDTYVDTLVTAPQKTRNAAGDVDERTKAMEKQLDELDR